MKTIIRYRDENGNIIGSMRQEEVSDLIDVLLDFSVALIFIGLIIIFF